MRISPDKIKIATAVALLFHLVGLIGILIFDQGFAWLTSLHMLVMAGLLIWTQPGRNGDFFLFVLICFTGGILAEIAGVHTGWLFGEYAYGSTLGWKVMEVPLLIGVNWFILVYCCGVTMRLVHRKMLSVLKPEQHNLLNRWRRISLVVDGALLAVCFDWILEPVAVKLGYWTWLPDGNIPFSNYLGWFVVSCLLLIGFAKLHFNKVNRFALYLLMIEVLFFLMLRTFL